MCLIAFEISGQPGAREIFLFANRDEFFERPTRELHRWENGILAGKDLEAGGTWLGLGKEGKISFLTNYRDLNNIRKDVRSRGELVSDFLENDVDAQEYLSKVQKKGSDYNGFNLVVGSPNGFFYYSNEGAGIQELENGLFGLSNGLLDEPWPKVEKIKSDFIGLGAEEKSEEALFRILKNGDTFPDQDLPSTGADMDLERSLSAMFIRREGYGSRVSSILDFKTEKDFRFWERTYDFPGNEMQTKFYFSGSSKLLSASISPS